MDGGRPRVKNGQILLLNGRAENEEDGWLASAGRWKSLMRNFWFDCSIVLKSRADRQIKAENA
jgi:hypothetical protein